MGEKGNLVFLHEVNTKEISDGKRVIHEEQVIHGDKGLLIKYYHKEDDKAEKIVIVKKGDEYSVRTMKGDQKEESMMSKDDLVKMLTKNKSLDFAVKYLKTQKGGKKKSKRGTKKGSKKSSKKKRGSKH